MTLSKKYINKRCVYCLEFFERLEEEHVFPLSWYSDSMPDNIEKIKVPACKECNRKYKPIEEDLRLRIGLCLDPNNPSSLGIPERTIRSVDPNSGRDENDKYQRMQKRQSLLKKIMHAKRLPLNSIYPGFGPQEGKNFEEQDAITVSADNLRMFGEKLVRGIAFSQKGIYIEKDHKIDIKFEGAINPVPIVELIKAAGKYYEWSTAIRAGVFFAYGDPQCSVFDLLLWGSFRFYAFITLKATHQVSEINP